MTSHITKSPWGPGASSFCLVVILEREIMIFLNCLTCPGCQHRLRMYPPPFVKQSSYLYRNNLRVNSILYSLFLRSSQKHKTTRADIKPNDCGILLYLICSILFYQLCSTRFFSIFQCLFSTGCLIQSRNMTTRQIHAVVAILICQVKT